MAADHGRVARLGISVLLLLAAAPLAGHEEKETFGPGDDTSPIVIPPISALAYRPVASTDLLGIRDIRGMSISPDGTEIALVVSQAVSESNRYRNELFIVGTQVGAAPVSVGTLGPPFWSGAGQWLPEAPRWSPDSKFVAYLMKRAGSWQVWVHSLGGRGFTQITHCPTDVQDYRWSSDGSKIVFETYDPPTPEQVQRLEDAGVLYDDSIAEPWNIDVSIVQKRLDLETQKLETWVHTIKTSEERRATLEEVRQFPRSALSSANEDVTAGPWSPDHTKFVYNRLEKCGKFKCYVLALGDAAGNASRVLTPGAAYAEDPQWSADGRDVYFESVDFEGRSTLSVVDVGNSRVRKLIADSDALFWQCSWDESGKHAACLKEDSVTPAEIAYVDAISGEVRVVADFNPEFKKLHLGEVVPIEWKNATYMHAHLVKPLDYQRGRRYPLVIITYREESFLRGGVGDEYPIQVLAAQGFAVVSFDIGAIPASRPGDFEAARETIYEAPLAGVRHVIQVLDDMGIIDPLRVATTGLSHGAELSSYWISHSNLFRAAAMSEGGSQDLMEYFVAGPSMRDALKSMGLIGRAGPEFRRYAQISPSLNVDRIHTPVLLNESDSEYYNFLEFDRTLRDRRRPLEVWVYPRELHVKNQPRHRLAIYEKNVDWMRFWLKGEEDRVPEKTEQYRRWETLCDLQRAETLGQPAFCVPSSGFARH
jgi:dipeptidyl aminopeptidase/acylaminoacyl peptidase